MQGKRSRTPSGWHPPAMGLLALLAGIAPLTRAQTAGAPPGVPLAATQTSPTPAEPAPELPVAIIPNLGEAAEWYFSPDGEWLIGNAKREGDNAHRVYLARRDGTEIRRINDRGADACSFFFPDGRRIVWTSTRDHPELPAGSYSDPNAYPQGAELYASDLHGGGVVRLTNNQVYDSEVSVSPDGKWILFTRQVDGKLDLWRMGPDGSGEEPITRTPEWQEGGAFYLPDSETVIYRAWRIEDQAQRGMPMTIFTIRHDGTGLKRITHDPGTHWAPHPAPDGKHFAFVKLLSPRNFEIFVMSLETGEQRRLTHHEGFDGFPAFSPDGRSLAFASSRDVAPGERRLFTYVMDVASLGFRP